MKRVRRDFINDLWTESRSVGEQEWKSSARAHLVNFENQLHEAVDAGLGHSYSGKRSWTLTNSILYSLSLTTTIGTKQIAVKVHKIIYCLRFIHYIHIGFLLVSRNYFASIQLIFQDMVIYRQYQFMDSC